MYGQRPLAHSNENHEVYLSESTHLEVMIVD